MTTQAIAAPTRFQLALQVSDLPRSVRFYQLLLNGAPVQATSSSARFETDSPPLALTLTAGAAKSAASTLNHLGFRMPDQATLVDLQRRLEEGGIATQRQEGVECCYALQTKFWVTDPDRHLWELYVFHEDIDHSGFDDHANVHPWKPKAAPKVWTHRLTDPVPGRLEAADGSLDEVHLEGTWNAKLDAGAKTQLLGEIMRVLRPEGLVAVHGMCGDRPFPGAPHFPGIAAYVKHVPTCDEMIDDLQRSGFVNLTLEKFDGLCLSVPGMELREIRLLGTRPEPAGLNSFQYVLYRGPFEEIVDDQGVTFRRGERVSVNAATCAALRLSAVADQFVFLT